MENCSGCHKYIVGSYAELGLPNEDGKEVERIVLCSSCYKEYLKHSAINVQQRKSNVEKIVELIKLGKTSEEIAAMLNVSIDRINSIRSNKKIFS